MLARVEQALNAAHVVVAEMTVLHGQGHPGVRWAEFVARRGEEMLRAR